MESKRSCCSKEKVCGVRIEKACYIFSLVNVVAVSVCLAACLYYIGWLSDLYLRPEKHKTYSDSLGLVQALNTILCTIVSLSTGIAFSFAVLLCYGVQKKISSFLMAYFVYGILVEVLSVAGTIAFIIESYDEDGVETDRAVMAAAALVGCAIYVFPLILVRWTYVKFVNTPGPANTSLLQEIEHPVV